MVTKDDVVGYLRKPTIGKLKCLHDKDISNDERFHNNKTLFPKINLIDEIEIKQHRYVHKGDRLSMEDSLFIIDNPVYWDLYTKIDLSVLAFGVNISDSLVQYILVKETEILNNLIQNGEFELAIKTLASKWWSIHSMFLIREVKDTGIELQRCLIEVDDLDSLIKYAEFRREKSKNDSLSLQHNVTQTITLDDINKLVGVKNNLAYQHTHIAHHIMNELDEIIHLMQTRYDKYIRSTELVHK